MTRKHPLFPTFQEVEKESDLARSDHLPVMTKIPLGEKKESLTIVSLNILGNEGCSGVHPLGMTIPEGHTLERYQHLASGLAHGIKKHGVDVILLQEADKSIVPYLEEKLGKGWNIIVDDFGIISCYNKERFVLQDTTADKESRIRTMAFTDTRSGLSIDVHNLWGVYSPFPHHMEKQYRSLLTKTKSKLSVIMGDTNSRLAPPADHTKRNLTTGIVPPIIAKTSGLPSDTQITDHPDGGFYRDESGIIHQLSTETLDFDTAEIVRDERSEADANVWPEYRMVMCLDNYYQETAIVDGKTLFLYEDALQREFGNDNLVVRMASNSFNNKALAIRFPRNSEAFKLIQSELKNEAGFQFTHVDPTDNRDGHQPLPCVFAPIEKVALLHKAVQKAISETVLKNQVTQRIQSEIERLSEAHWYLHDASEKISSLKELKIRLSTATADSTDKDLLSIIKTWEAEAAPASQSTRENNIKNKHELMGVHRNIFFKPIRPGKSTETQNTLQWLKEALGDAPNQGVQPEPSMK
ncbi:endonuclease/exonuclease/phosphatase family protein [Legionella taurinensis]|uniref:Endonuclease/exonuclease/phosphatase family protein n=1 Tax=Legionella taurinensis TaxID=70611 RepID=A0AB38N121_9GAMM|nr:endonuclease/exonuclease/phosphatase family protein [Legionella taurinensis]MDX1836033.1 endonuclease/exonuclease/phosphatase family protein [Legionella taurinensis]PUT38738.1 hypothetical protein DB744_13265 [Legionella taurinensis]PUT40117.1 hypothetical protein DB746_12665 [Legionella taurinensis]PUT42269.1 hypothetical protein DB743_13150 [Legionella taurinensis]PUT46041.1 hypothetical protein DB745_12120 [Legionella taurinensis]